MIGQIGTPLAALILLASCGDSPRDQTPERWTPPSEEAELYPVTIAAPPGAGKLTTPVAELSGTPAGIGCPTCHVEGAVAPLAGRRARPDDSPFHAAIEIVHGDLECASCHDDAAPQRLRLASGKAVAIAGSIRLCSQCHGPIRRAFDHGAHGGMRGYWDLQRGPRTRNTCITCHDPHRPAYPKVTPVAGPRDRFVPKHAPAGSLVERRFGKERR